MLTLHILKIVISLPTIDGTEVNVLLENGQAMTELQKLTRDISTLLLITTFLVNVCL